MFALILLGLLIGLDNLRVSIVLGTLHLSLSDRRRLALAFGLFETLMPLAGFIVSQSISEGVGPWAEYIGPLALGGTGLIVISNALRCHETTTYSSKRWLILGLPFSLSLDNFLAGIGLGANAFPVGLSALVIGAISGLMAMLGLYLGDFIRRHLLTKAELLGGIAMLLLAVFKFGFEL